jgi:hypothetical protein
MTQKMQNYFDHNSAIHVCFFCPLTTDMDLWAYIKCLVLLKINLKCIRADLKATG